MQRTIMDWKLKKKINKEWEKIIWVIENLHQNIIACEKEIEKLKK